MSLLSQITKGKIRQPILALAYGVDGVGKSTLGATAPNPIFMGAEKGTATLDVARLPAPKNWKEVLQAIDELTKEKHDFQTLVIDSLDWLEPMCWEAVIFDNSDKGWKNIEDPGFAKGYTIALKYWNDMISRLSKLRETRGMNILAIAHSQVKLAKDPQNMTEYDRYQLKLNDRAAALWREFVDEVFFVNFEIYTTKDKGKVRAFGGELRYLYTERRPGFDAKNRHSLPEKIAVSRESAWQDMLEAYSSVREMSGDEYISNIEEMLKQVKDTKLRDAVKTSLDQAGHEDLPEIQRIYNKLRVYLGRQEVA